MRSAPADASSTASEVSRKELLELILRVSFRRGRVVLSSGQPSDFYLDLRQTLMLPLGQKLAGELMLAKLMVGTWPDAIGGMAVGAVPLVAAVLAAAARRDPETPLLGFFVRKQAKTHGLGRRIEGGLAAGQKVALLEDTVTTGASTLEALEAVEAERATVARVLCLVDRGEGGAARFAARGIELEALYTRADLPL